jgi:anti-sigma factor RsiW
MRCTDIDELIEPIAAGEIEPDAVMSAHLQSCEVCGRALAMARQIDLVFAAQPAPEPPPGFTAALMTRLRRERWRSEQFLDVAFNVAVGLAVAVGVGGVVMVATASGLAAVSADLVRVFLSATTSALATIAPALPVYALASAVVVSWLLVWWWAEHGFEL